MAQENAPILTLEEKLDPRSTALLVVDMQNDFAHSDGHFPRSGPAGFTDLSGVSKIERPLQGLIRAAREANILRVFIRSIFDPIYLTAPFAEKRIQLGSYGKACLDTTWGADYLEQFRPDFGPHEVEVRKHRYSAFHDTNILAILRSAAIRTVVVTGVTTSVCVDSTVRDAFFNDFYVVIPEDGSADYTDEKHRVFLQQMGALFGTVCQASDVVSVWQHKLSPATGGR